MGFAVHKPGIDWIKRRHCLTGADGVRAGRDQEVRLCDGKVCIGKHAAIAIIDAQRCFIGTDGGRRGIAPCGIHHIGRAVFDHYAAAGCTAKLVFAGDCRCGSRLAVIDFAQAGGIHRNCDAVIDTVGISAVCRDGRIFYGVTEIMRIHKAELCVHHVVVAADLGLSGHNGIAMFPVRECIMRRRRDGGQFADGAACWNGELLDYTLAIFENDCCVTDRRICPLAAVFSVIARSELYIIVADVTVYLAARAASTRGVGGSVCFVLRRAATLAAVSPAVFQS